MQSQPLFSGSIVALITPFMPSGRIDWESLEHLVQWQIEQGTDGIICSGTTGEGAALTRAERKKIVEICVSVAAGRIPIIAGTGTSDTRLTTCYTEDAQKKGAAGCLVVTPYYNRPTQRGCLAHFQEVAKVGLPAIVYHNPSRAAFRFTVESVQALSEISSIVGFKDSSRDLALIRSIRETCPLPIFSGEDDLTYEIIEEGAIGSISVAGNVVPGSWRRMIYASLAKEKKLARQWASLLMPLCKGLFVETNPQGIKYILSLLGKCHPILRLPLMVPSEETQQILHEALLRLCLLQFIYCERSQTVNLPASGSH